MTLLLNFLGESLLSLSNLKAPITFNHLGLTHYLVFLWNQTEPKNIVGFRLWDEESIQKYPFKYGESSVCRRELLILHSTNLTKQSPFPTTDGGWILAQRYLALGSSDEIYRPLEQDPKVNHKAKIGSSLGSKNSLTVAKFRFGQVKTNETGVKVRTINKRFPVPGREEYGDEGIIIDNYIIEI